MTFVSQQKPTIRRSVQPTSFPGVRTLTECHECLSPINYLHRICLRILKTPPPANVLNENNFKVDPLAIDSRDELLTCRPRPDRQAAFANILIGANNVDALGCRPFAQYRPLIDDGIFPLLGGHPNPFNGANAATGVPWNGKVYDGHEWLL